MDPKMGCQAPLQRLGVLRGDEVDLHVIADQSLHGELARLHAEPLADLLRYDYLTLCTYYVGHSMTPVHPVQLG